MTYIGGIRRGRKFGPVTNPDLNQNSPSICSCSPASC